MHPSHNSVMVVFKRPKKGGEDVKVLLLKCLPIPNHHEDELFYKLPGGKGKSSEDPVATARRELKEETGLKAPKKVPLLLINFSEASGNHGKYGYAVDRSECKGALRKGPYNEGSTRVVGFEWVSVDRAPELIKPRAGNRSQHDILSLVKESFRLHGEVVTT